MYTCLLEIGDYFIKNVKAVYLIFFNFQIYYQSYCVIILSRNRSLQCCILKVLYKYILMLQISSYNVCVFCLVITQKASVTVIVFKLYEMLNMIYAVPFTSFVQCVEKIAPVFYIQPWPQCVLHNSVLPGSLSASSFTSTCKVQKAHSSSNLRNEIFILIHHQC